MIKNSIQFLNTQFSLDKKLIVSLTQIFGINLYLATLICRKFGFNKNSYIKDLNTDVINEMRKFIISKFLIQSTLKRQVQTSISFLNEIKSVKGLRHKLKLPVRGQRTRTNHKTIKRL
jgi:small subunit ribosomal protein S13